MKKLFLVFGIAVLAACNSADKKTDATTTKATNDTNVTSINDLNSTDGLPRREKLDTSNFTSIEWIDKINQNLPKIKEGEVIEVTYRFKNTGTKPLTVEDVQASCGCTVPEKPEEPILPGKEGLIKAKFDSHGKSGTNTKTITVMANTNSDKILTFTVDVEK